MLCQLSCYHCLRIIQMILQNLSTYLTRQKNSWTFVQKISLSLHFLPLFSFHSSPRNSHVSKKIWNCPFPFPDSLKVEKNAAFSGKKRKMSVFHEKRISTDENENLRSEAEAAAAAAAAAAKRTAKRSCFIIHLIAGRSHCAACVLRFAARVSEKGHILSAAIGQRPRNYSSCCCCCSFPFVSIPL